MSNKIKYAIAGLIAILLMAAGGAVWFMNYRYDVLNNVDDLKNKAIVLYETGDYETAIIQLETYCNHVATDVEARALLGDWYDAKGDENTAIMHYYQAATNKQMEENRINSLSVKNPEEILLEPVTKIKIEITPDVRRTSDMTLMITNHNLVPEKKFEGKISGTEAALTDDDNFYTTDWFSVDTKGKYLTMSGGFNHAVWQFKNEWGEIFAYAESSNTYRQKDTYSVNVYQMARANIPDKAVACRVTYFDKNKENMTASVDEELTIVYGRLPGESRNADVAYYKIPDLVDGEKIVFENSKWTMVTEKGETELADWKVPAIERGSHFSIGGVLPGRVSFEECEYADYSMERIYSIRFDSENPSATGERMDDAKNLGFNANIGNGYLALGENHFDNIYPWKDIKLCAIKDGKIAYEGEAEFATLRETGDVFVEIPKFYVRRSIDFQYDTISISGVQHENFYVDDAFVTPEGIVDKIYVAAYLTSEDNDGNLRSISGDTPVLNLSPKQLDEKTNAKGEGFAEIDYATLSAVQKLFMVETGLRNSQYAFMGVCGYSLASRDGNSYSIATETAEKSNSIVVESRFTYVEGNSIVLFDCTDYDGSIAEAIENARKITAVITNNDGTRSVYFDGEPMNIYEGVTAIAHIAVVNGATRAVSGHTGAVSTDRGTVGFKYRNIENLWGNAYVYISKVKIKNGEVTLTNRNNVELKLGFKLPDGLAGSINENMIRRIGCDPYLPQVFLPLEIGKGATISTFYGDAFISENIKNKEYVLHYGGGWNSGACAGLFAYTVSSAEDEIYTNTTGRMMYFK